MSDLLTSSEKHTHLKVTNTSRMMDHQNQQCPLQDNLYFYFNQFFLTFAHLTKNGITILFI